jgi:hypothetical protein
MKGGLAQNDTFSRRGMAAKQSGISQVESVAVEIPVSSSGSLKSPK